MSRVAVIGAGVSGLISAYRLSQAGFQVTVFESEAVAGGLASSVEIDGTRIDRYFHFICPPDTAHLTLLHDLGLQQRLHWCATRMGVFRNGEYFRFGTPASLLAFTPLPLTDRVRFGLATLRARSRSGWRDLDSLTAREWLIAEQGERCYDVIWRPLLEQKFGSGAEDVSAAWIWARINRVARSRRGVLGRERFGYLEGGTWTLIEALQEGIEVAGGQIRLSSSVEALLIDRGRVTGVRVAGVQEPFDLVVSTVAPPLLAALTEDLPADYSAALRGISYLGVACWVLVTRAPLCADYWLNISDPQIPFPGVITYTHLDPVPALGGLHVHYVPLYMAEDDPRWPLGHDEGLRAVLEALDRIRPGFSDGLVHSFLFKDRWAQPVQGAGFGSRYAGLLGPQTPVTGLYRADMSQVYPHDRSLVNAADQAVRLARSASATADGILP